MAIHIAPLMLHVRCYPDTVDVDKPMCEMSGGYRYHMVVLINDLGIARLEGLDGRVSHRDRRELANKLRGYGVRRVEWRHHDIEKHHNLE
jgi:hypothetical protein